MSEPITNIGKSPVPSSLEPIPEYKRQVQTDAVQPIPGFGAAFSALAFTPTALGELAANVSMKAGVALAERQGQKLGKNPEGDLLPALTPVDKAFVDAYSTQAEATLGLQAQTLLDKSKEQLSQAYMLSPGQISDFRQKTMEGVQGILQHAPSTIRAGMENQYASTIQSETHQLNMKMIGEQKTLATDNSALFRKNQDLAMQNAIRDGNIALADQIYQSIQANVKSGLQTHMLSPLQADAANHAAKLNYYGTQEIAKAAEAREQHKIEPFLSDMLKHKPGNLGWDEWTSIQNMTVSAIGQMENLDNRNQTLMAAQMKDDALYGKLDAEKIAYYKENLQPARFLNSMAPLISSQKTTSAAMQKTYNLAAHGQDSAVWAGATAKEKNGAFDMLVQGQLQDAQSKGVDLNEAQAKVLVAKSMAGPVPKYIDELNLNGQSQNPALIAQASHSLDILDTQAGGNVAGIHENTRATIEAYKNYKMQGYDDEQAGIMARDTVVNKTEEQRKTNEAIVGEWNRKFATTSSNRDKFARKFIHTGGAFVANQQALSNQIVSTYKDYLKLFNGDENMAQAMLQKGVDRAYSTTNVNGVEQYTYFPPEKALGLPSGATPLIQADVVNQLTPQLRGIREAFDNGTSEFYYKIKGRVSIEDYMAAKDVISKAQTLKSYGKSLLSGIPPHLEKEFKTIDDFESGKPIEMEKIYRDSSTKRRPPVSEPGNIDIYNRPKVNLPNGKIATVMSRSFNFDGKEVLLPLVSKEGKIWSDKEARDNYIKTGENLGKFNSVSDADAYADWLHTQQQEYILGEKTSTNPHNEIVKIAVDSSPYMSITTDDNPMIGGYDINAQTQSGRSIAIMGPFSGPLNPPVYRPNKNWIYERFFAVNNLQPDNRPLVQQAKELVRAQDERASRWSHYLSSAAIGH